jgi:DsbC/DsbD-like thiol-disulfide interchange protein
MSNYIPVRVSVRDHGNTIITERLTAESMPKAEALVLLAEDKVFIAQAELKSSESKHSRAQFAWQIEVAR